MHIWCDFLLINQFFGLFMQKETLIIYCTMEPFILGKHSIISTLECIQADRNAIGSVSGNTM